MPSYYAQQIEAIRFHRETADRLQDELNVELETLFKEGLVSRPADEDPVKALGKYLGKLRPDELISAADIKEKVPATRDLTHRAITAMLRAHPGVIETGEKDQHALKQYRRIFEQLPLQIEAPSEAPVEFVHGQ